MYQVFVIRHLFLGYRGLSRPASVFYMMMMMMMINGKNSQLEQTSLS